MGSTGPLNNGERYAWEQTLKEITMRFRMPEGVTSRQLRVEYASDHVTIANKETGAVLLDARTRGKLRPDGCVWSRDPDTGEVLVELEKRFPLMEAPTFWSSVFRGHPRIDCEVNGDGTGNNQVPMEYMTGGGVGAGGIPGGMRHRVQR